MRELHDTVKQNLCGATMMVEACVEAQMEDPSVLRELLGRALEVSREAEHQLSQPLEELGLNPGPRVECLSYGTRKKLALVLALVHEPELLVLDEPMNGLDPASAEAVEGLLRRHAAGAGAVVLSTHSLEFAAAFASGIGVMREGRIASRGVRWEGDTSGAGGARGGDG